MSWGRIDDNFHDHPKVELVSLEAIGLHWLAVSYCNRQKTDGRITLHRVRVLARRTDGERLADELVNARTADDKAGLWERDGDGYRIHDFLHFNRSAAQRQKEQKDAVRRMRALRKRSREQDRIHSEESDPNFPVTPLHPVPMGPGTGTGRESPEGGAGETGPDTPQRRAMGLLPLPGPLPVEFVFSRTIRELLMRHGCANPDKGFSHFRLHYAALEHDRAKWTRRWDLKLQEWALRHDEMGCPCQKRGGPHRPEATYPDVEAEVEKQRAEGMRP